MDGSQPDPKRLRRDVELALRRALDPAAVLPMLHRLSRLTGEGTDENVYAQRQLAELLAETHPWRAALHARRVLAVHEADDGAWAILALCHALLGHYRCAADAYRRAAVLAPDNPAYAHNLGHLMDVALGRPTDALPWLEAAYVRTKESADVALSFAHALGRAGRLGEAKLVADRALETHFADSDGTQAREHAALVAWLDQGAPEEQAVLPRRPPARVSAPSPRQKRRARSANDGGPLDGDALDATLLRGLANLPLDRPQRARARTLARDLSVTNALTNALTNAVTSAQHGKGTNALATMAAALVYAIVYVDHVPLTQADVAACFRVSVQALRGLFKALRSHLDITPGDARFATVRPR